VGVGSGRKRLNILGAYCPDDHEYIGYRLTRDNINGSQFVNLLRVLREKHPGTERQPDRAAVEVPACQGVEQVAPDV
jgi:hypothetical protein